MFILQFMPYVPTVLIENIFIIVSVEFPAVLLNTKTGDIESEFHYYVQPMESPMLSDFCKELTGISQVGSCENHVL